MLLLIDMWASTISIINFKYILCMMMDGKCIFDWFIVAF